MPSPETQCSILVAEDEWLIAMDIGMLIEELGHVVVGPAQNVSSAMALIDVEEIDAAFLDITLGREQSFPIAEKLDDLDVPLTFLSAYTQKDIPPEFRKYDLLTKPLATPLFRKQLLKMLGQN